MNELLNSELHSVNPKTAALSLEESELILHKLVDWEIDTQEQVLKLKKEFSFPDFSSALDFSREIGSLAEAADHHPKMTITWGCAVIEWWTHSIGGLHMNDFILAAKTSEAYKRYL